MDVGEERVEEAVRNKSLNCEEQIFRKLTDTYRSRYKYKSEEEPRCVKNILRKLVAFWMKRTEKRRSSHAPPDRDQFEERKDQYLSNIRIVTERNVLCLGTDMDFTGFVGMSPSGTKNTSYGRVAATSAVNERRDGSNNGKSSRAKRRSTDRIELELKINKETEEMEIRKRRHGSP